MDASLPGIGCDENTTVSRSPIFRKRWLPSAMRFRAARGSPCEPVQTTQVRAGSMSSSSVSGASILSEILSRPSSLARVTLRTIDGPMTTIVRPVAAAASTTCWIRCTWLENAPTMIRLPSLASNTCLSTGPTVVSEVEDPAMPAFVESASNSLIPDDPASSRSLGRSVTRPSTGVGSNLKSLECRMRPCGVPKMVIRPLGVEWVTGRNSQSNGPMRSLA